MLKRGPITQKQVNRNETPVRGWHHCPGKCCPRNFEGVSQAGVQQAKKRGRFQSVRFARDQPRGQGTRRVRVAVGILWGARSAGELVLLTYLIYWLLSKAALVGIQYRIISKRHCSARTQASPPGPGCPSPGHQPTGGGLSCPASPRAGGKPRQRPALQRKCTWLVRAVGRIRTGCASLGPGDPQLRGATRRLYLSIVTAGIV